MTKSEILKRISELDCPDDTEVYFDVEAATFDTHVVEITNLELLPAEVIGEPQIILGCDSQERTHPNYMNLVKEYLFNTAQHDGLDKNIEPEYLKQTIEFLHKLES